MFISIFSDELGLDVREALPIIRSWGLDYVDFRSAIFGKAIERLTAEELRELRQLCDKNGLKVGCLQTSLAKVHLPEDPVLRAEEAKLEGIIRAADALDCRMARVFHYWQPNTKELQGALSVRPDEMQKVLDRFHPLAERAKSAGLTCAFENCGVTPAEVLAFVERLGIGDWGIAWDLHNGWECPERKADEARFVETMMKRCLCIHVKAMGSVPGLKEHPLIPYGKVLAFAYNSGLKGPVSAETHNPAPTVTHTEMSKRVVGAIRAAWPTAAPGAAVYEMAPADSVTRAWANQPVGFVVVGLGMGHNRSRMVKDTPGARLVGVCDIREDRAKRASEDFGVPYSLDVRDWLKEDEVEAVFVLTETGRHAEIALQAIEAGKHVMTTKPMEASLAACDAMIRAAERMKVILAVDFSFRFTPHVMALRNAVRNRRFGRMLGGSASLMIQRTMAYFKENGGWRGTRRWDGGGVLSNQSIHHIDEIAYVLGIPAQVRCDIWTQNHDIEAEDLGSAVWKYADGTIVTFTASSCYPHDTWYNRLELFGTEGAFSSSSGGPFLEPQTRWFGNNAWSNTAPEAVKSEWLNSVDNLAAAIRTGAPLVADGREGRRTQAILDAMYRSACHNNCGWTEVHPELGVSQ